ncbi:protein FAM200B-like [Microcaecilia unicolor]|uniref:Protein FAM200B-like n=1 Tax=Microcaecilia unicolor TaxID=1415580 RepID=A0A6P7X774_9AMPH|nr:protein FAM200B-like [Microcaecilia unicolor]XP_030049151.1 protein FAM200B-like [Microcaecilia unicolor]
MPKRNCSFTDVMKAKYPCFRSGRHDREAECITCGGGTYISVAHNGALDLEAHIRTSKHVKNVRGESSSMKLSDFFITPCSKIDDSVSAVEGTLAFHAVKHHHSYKSMDCSCRLVKTILSDSNIARKISCAQTKTEAIVNSVLAPHSVDVVVKALSCVRFCGVATDGSNHGSQKLFPILIYYFDWKNGGLQSKLIDVHITPDETAESISTCIKNTLDRHSLFQKCIAFAGDNCNTNFGGVQLRAAGQNVFANLKKMKGKSSGNGTLVEIGCPAHVLNNCIQHGADTLDVDIESIVLKIYNYFSIYTVRTEHLKEYCEFVEVEYRQLLYHCKTRWLSLFPSIHRMLQMFPALKSFFLSQEEPPAVIRNFFENDFSEIYLWHMHSLMNVFHSHIEKLERDNNSLLEVMNCLKSVQSALTCRAQQSFMSLKVKELLKKLRQDGLDDHCDAFCSQVASLYTTCLEYLEMWTVPLEEFTVFSWMAFTKIPSWDEVLATVAYLKEKEIDIDDSKCFDQFCNLKRFVESNQNEDFEKLLSHEKWVKYFNRCKTEECFSELLIIAEYFFAIPSHNANNTEQVFFP